jgi:hypothetical protein
MCPSFFPLLSKYVWFYVKENQWYLTFIASVPQPLPNACPEFEVADLVVLDLLYPVCFAHGDSQWGLAGPGAKGGWDSFSWCRVLSSLPYFLYVQVRLVAGHKARREC